MAAIRRIAINTGGGDAPGLNAVIHSAVYAARNLGWEIVGIRDGYDGLLFPERYQSGGLVPLRRGTVRDIAHLGGTILGTTNRGNPFRSLARQPDGSVRETDRSQDVLDAMRAHGIDALIAVGGDGSLGIAHQLQQRGLRVVGVPKTIDNDLESTVMTFGFDSAVSFATECIDRLHTTASAHRRVMVVETMGRYAGWIALHSGVAGRADVILIPEIPFDLDRAAECIARAASHGRNYAIVVVAEGAAPRGGSMSIKSAQTAGKAEQLGGIGDLVASGLGDRTGMDARTVVLGHLLRGGSPTATDRLLGLAFGTAAVRALREGMDGVMVSIAPPHVRYVPLADAVAALKRVPPDGDIMLAARTLGISFGD